MGLVYMLDRFGDRPWMTTGGTLMNFLTQPCFSGDS
jgi:hypothetical protein